jgi:hypothetical protein
VLGDLLVIAVVRYLNGNALSGSIPSELAELSRLIVLSVIVVVPMMTRALCQATDG